MSPNLRTHFLYLLLLLLVVIKGAAQEKKMEAEELVHLPKYRVGIVAFSSATFQRKYTGLYSFTRKWNGLTLGYSPTERFWINATFQNYHSHLDHIGPVSFIQNLNSQVYALGSSFEFRVLKPIELIFGTDLFLRVQKYRSRGSNDVWPYSHTSREDYKEWGLQVHGGIKFNIFKYLYIKGQVQYRPLWFYLTEGEWENERDGFNYERSTGMRSFGPRMNRYLITMGVQI
jgi:hypothetical protein